MRFISPATDEQLEAHNQQVVQQLEGLGKKLEDLGKKLDRLEKNLESFTAAIVQTKKFESARSWRWFGWFRN